MDCVHFKRRNLSDKNPLGSDAMKSAFRTIDDDIQVEDLVEKYLREANGDNKLQVLIP